MLENLGVILVQIWCNILCDDTHDVHEIARNECFSTIFRGVNASEKTPRDNLCGISCGANKLLPHTENCVAILPKSDIFRYAKSSATAELFVM